MRVLFAVIFAILAPLVDIGVKSLFPTLAQTQTPAATWVIVGLYLGVAQYLVARKGRGFSETFPTVIAMAAPAVIAFMAGIAEIELSLFCLVGTVVGAVAASIV